MRPILAFVAALVRSAFISRRDLALENAALRQQLAAYVRGKKYPHLKLSERAIWVVLSRFWRLSFARTPSTSRAPRKLGGSGNPGAFPIG